MRPARTITALCAALAFLFCIPSRAQGPSDSCPCTLRGTVVNSVSGQPIHGALVYSTSPPVVSTFTDAEGKFQFDALPSGSITLQAAKPGFDSLNHFFGSSLKPSTVRVAPDAATPAILKLIPDGVIYGQVTDVNGEPLEGLSLSVFQLNPINGGLIPNILLHVSSDDEGNYRIAHLAPGTYYLEVQPANNPALSATRNSAAPQGYAPSFYPGVPEKSLAHTIT
jgi:Carboxypeptidase regulatory-like domain